ncbi:MAG TPA: alanine racemase [Acidimicrobiales bacterium]|jgi:alanine racemase|nr:alanine racemase [Acidimicrobiales bacterium]
MSVRPATTERDALRPAWAEIDLGAIRHNAALLAGLVAPAQLCAVVKAWGYGHGPVEVAEAALAGGATWLAVALVEEGRHLRAAGVAAPILLLSEPPAEAMAEVVASGLTATLYTAGGADALSQAARARGRQPAPVHVKVDTGMHRVGAAPAGAVDLGRRVAADEWLALEGLYTHFAVADEPAAPETAEQLARFLGTADRLAEHGIAPRLLHAANSAGALLHPASRLDLVRCGIALYGLAPSAALRDQGACARLRPAMTLAAHVSYVKVVDAGERLSYGLRYRLSRRSVIATVPLGYADGVTRSLSSTGGQVLIGGRRYPIAGTVTMDQILVDCGPDADVAAGDTAVLVGRQGDEEITAWEWAQRVGSIAYEVVCGVSSRVPRMYQR